MQSAAKLLMENVKSENLDMVDLKFIDLPGTWQHFSLPASELSEEMFVEGCGFDGSSIRGFQDINESDMLLIPDPSTAFKDPFSKNTISMICDVRDPVKKIPYSKDPRFIAQKALAYLRETGIADETYWGPEAEFFIFDSMRYGQNENTGYYAIDSNEGIWNSGREENGGNLGYKLRHKEGYFPVPPSDALQEIRNEIVRTMIGCGIHVEVHHHEVATAGQCEIDLRYASMVRMADQLMMYKYIVKNVAVRHNKTATFMPKPIFNDNGSGMHCHQSLFKNGRNLFFDPNGYAMISQMALHYIGGLIKHAPALCAIIAPTTNSYKRLVPGFEAPVNLVYSQRNRSASIRIPMYSEGEKTKRIEFRVPDPSCNPYLAFPAMLMAGLDGIKNKIDPGKPLDKDIYKLPVEEAAKIPTVPGSLSEALDALENDHEFLLKGNVFTKDVIETWIDFKRKKEVDAIRLRPHPWEFHLYSDV
ncbi:MAG TPA: type I glutamate--ammonia ligase [Candidatus Nanoarchaeia archaeon]|nr:type I glutamate--ammonia ligase [Candidatus Nanoarchaeia archaeon]